MLYLKNSYTFLKHIIVIPLISTVLIPLLILDIWMEIYHRICFPLCGMTYIRRKDYIKIIDRAKLQYLNWFQKIYCMYCGYGNGVIRYWARIAEETEHYWCGIKHKNDSNFITPEHHKDFSEYGNEDDFKKKYCE